MVIRNKLFAATAIGSTLLSLQVSAAEIERNTAQMQAMDKITGRVSVVEVPVNSEVSFGSFSIVVRACKTTPPEETPENYAFVDVADSSFGKMQFNIFKGWMMSSSPALNAVEHPIYDVWLLKCLDTDNKGKLLTAEQLKERDALPKLADIKQKPESTDKMPVKEETIQAVTPAPAVSVDDKDKIIDSFALPMPAQNETAPVATAPLDSVPAIEKPAEPAVENASGPQSLLNLTDAPVTAMGPDVATANRPDIKVDETNITETDDWVELPSADMQKPADAVVVETPVPAPLLPETPPAEMLAPVAVPAENSVSETSPADGIENLPEDDEDQFIDLGNEAEATAALEAELSAEALKN